MSGILQENNPDSLVYAVFTREKTQQHERPEMIGIVGVHRTTPIAELGYIFHPSVWNQGYASEALLTFLNLFWKLRPRVEVVEACTDYENYASQRVLMKCGFKEVKRLKEKAIIETKGPEKRDAIVFEKAPRLESIRSRLYKW